MEQKLFDTGDIDTKHMTYTTSLANGLDNCHLTFCLQIVLLPLLSLASEIISSWNGLP